MSTWKVGVIELRSMRLRIIRLQAVVEIITNKTASALELISNQQRQTSCCISEQADLGLPISRGRECLWKVQDI